MSADEIIAEIKAFQASGYRIMLRPDLDTAGRQQAMARLLERARRAEAPEFACRGVERALLDVVGGRNREATARERMLEDALRRGGR